MFALRSLDNEGSKCSFGIQWRFRSDCAADMPEHTLFHSAFNASPDFDLLAIDLGLYLLKFSNPLTKLDSEYNTGQVLRQLAF